ncbi:MAG: CHAT domain-containing protein [Anaerolineales bacterium]|nr:CHAT domain-containing protein [Anaerolineales bacterium]
MSNYPTTEKAIDRDDQRKLAEEALAYVATNGFKAENETLPFSAMEFFGIEGIGKTRALTVVKEICENKGLPFIAIESSFKWKDIEDRGTLISEFLRSICEQAGRDAGSANFAASASAVLEDMQRLQDGGEEHQSQLKEFIGVLAELYSRVHLPFILLLDKTEYCPQELFDWIGADFARLFVESKASPGVALFFAGKGERIRESRWPRFFKKASAQYKLDLFSPEFTEHHIGALPDGGIYKPATSLIYDLSNGHPYSTEMIVYELNRLGVDADGVKDQRMKLAESLYKQVIQQHILEDAPDWVKKFVEIASVPRWFKPDLLKRLFSEMDDLPNDFPATADAIWFTYKVAELRSFPWNLVLVTKDAYEIDPFLRKLIQKALSILHPQDTVFLHEKIKKLYIDLDSLDFAVTLEILFHTAVVATLRNRDALVETKNELERQLQRFDLTRDMDLQNVVQLKLCLPKDVELLDLLGEDAVNQLVVCIEKYLYCPLQNLNVTSVFSSPAEFRTSWSLANQSMSAAQSVYTHQRYEWNEWMQNMRDVGRSAFSAYIPRETQRFLQDHKNTPLQLTINYSHIPWELFHDGEDFLCLRHAMARKPQTLEQSVIHQPIPKNSKHALVIGNPTCDLPEAEKEALAVAELLKAHDWQVDVLIKNDATLTAFAIKLRNKAYRLIHFAGHGQFNVDAPNRSSLKFHDYPWLAEEFDRQLSSPAFIYLNACHTAQTFTENNLPCGEFMEGVALSTLKGGACGCLGPLRAVPDDLARDFAIEFYNRALNERTLGEAVRQARLVLRNKSPEFWAGWVLYGDPSQRLV